MRSITKDEIEIITKLMIENVKDINIQRYFFPDENHYLENMRLLYLFYCNYHFTNTFVSDDGKGAIIIHPPEETNMRTATIKETFSNFLYVTKLGVRLLTKLLSYQYWVNSFKSTLINESHYYLDILAIQNTYIISDSPNEKLKQCITSDDLMNSIILNAEKGGYKIYTETYTPANIPFFEEYGFKTAKESLLPHTNLTQYALIR